MFGKTYAEVREMIKAMLTTTQMSRDIVRKAGVRPGSGTGEPFQMELPEGGEAWHTITKLSDEDFDVGWRRNGQGPLIPDTSDPATAAFTQNSSFLWPCNARILTWTRLRDSLLRSGTNNSSRFGFALDAYEEHHRVDPFFGVGLVDRWYARDDDWRFFGAWFTLHEEHPDWSQNRDYVFWDLPAVPATNDPSGPREFRFTVYVTRADYAYSIRIAQEDFFSPADIIIDRGTATGRWVSDWITYNPNHGLTLAIAPTIAEQANNTPIVPTFEVAPTTYRELQEGAGPICVPFAEIEYRTHFNPGWTYWIHDAYTPEGFRDPATIEELEQL